MEYRPGGTTRGVDAGVTYRAAPKNMTITIEADRVMGAEATAAGMDNGTETTSGMGVR